MDKIPGWEGKDIEVGWGKLYSNHWNSQVVELDGKKNVKGYFEQKWTFNSDFELEKMMKPAVQPLIAKPAVLPIAPKPAVLVKPSAPTSISRKYKLSFQYACRKNIAFDSCQGNVFWNGEKSLHIVPVDHKVHDQTV